MKMYIYFLFFCIHILVCVGCFSTPNIVAQKYVSEKTDVFIEVPNKISVSQNESVLNIRVSLKTHLAGYYLLESKRSPYGKPSFKFLFNIDGQSVLWDVPGTIDRVQKYHENGKTNCCPDAGEGMLYILEKRISLAPGRHEVFFSLPDDGYYTEFAITVKKGGEHNLELRPLYCTCSMMRFPYRRPTFYGGLKKYTIIYDSNCCITQK